jgi:beta-phosphoglucomutase-like phosphatase (HAD superfamily)
LRPTLFDYNGVLVDDEAVHFAAFREAVAPLGIELDQEAYVARYLGFDDAAAFRAMLEDAGLPATDERIEALIEAKKPLYLARIDRVHAFRGAPELVARRAAHGPVGVVSGALRSEIELGLQKLGITAHVSFIVSAEDAPRCKPDPMGYLLAVAKLEAMGAASQGVAIEDSIAGIEAAKRAGLRCVAVTHTYSESELARAGADAIADSLASITDEMLG